MLHSLISFHLRSKNIQYNRIVEVQVNHVEMLCYAVLLLILTLQSSSMTLPAAPYSGNTSTTTHIDRLFLLHLICLKLQCVHISHYIPIHWFSILVQTILRHRFDRSHVRVRARAVFFYGLIIYHIWLWINNTVRTYVRVKYDAFSKRNSMTVCFY